YYYETDDSTEPVVIYMEKTKNNDEKIIQAEDIISYSNNVLTYYSGNRTVTEKIDIAHNLFYNGVLISDYDDSTFVPKTGYIKLVKDIASENYKYVFVQSFFNYFVSGLSLDDTELLFETPNSVDMIRIDLEKIKWELYDKNGKLTTGIGVTDTFNADGLKIKQYSLPPIPANSLISVFTDKPVYKNGHYSIGSDATYVKIFMNSETITGKVSSISEDNSGKIDSLVVDTTNYDVSSDHYLAEKGKAIKVSQLAAFYLDFDGKLAAYTVEEDSGNYVYAYLVNAFLRNGLRKSIDIKLLHTDNTFKVYSVSGSININDKKYTDLKLAYAELQKSAKLIVSTFTISQLVKVKINSNDEITNIQTVRQIGSALDPNNPDELVCNEAGQPFTTIKYGGATLVRTDAPILNKSGTITKGRVSLYGPPKVVFLVPSAETFDENDYEITTSYADATLDVFDINDGLTPAAAVNYGEVTDSKFDVPYIFVTEVFQSINEEGAVVDGVKGYTGFGEIKYYADKQGLFSDVKKGDIISVAGDKSAKIIKSYSHVFSVYDVLNVDYSLPMQPVTSLGSNLRAFMYENYYYTASNRMLVLQTGAEGDNNKREYQRVFHWTTVSNVLKYGLLTCTIDDDDNFTLKTSGPTDLHPAVNYGHEYSSKILIFESSDSIIKYMLIVNKK
ncbi:MAG: hypothetical protein IJQ50_04165, partial [Clostridia bacterium]|nr:hypothetical protein [Clostridia bacterium]